CGLVAALRAVDRALEAGPHLDAGNLRDLVAERVFELLLRALALLAVDETDVQRRLAATDREALPLSADVGGDRLDLGERRDDLFDLPDLGVAALEARADRHADRQLGEAL